MMNPIDKNNSRPLSMYSFENNKITDSSGPLSYQSATVIFFNTSYTPIARQNVIRVYRAWKVLGWSSFLHSASGLHLSRVGCLARRVCLDVGGGFQNCMFTAEDCQALKKKSEGGQHGTRVEVSVRAGGSKGRYYY